MTQLGTSKHNSAQLSGIHRTDRLPVAAIHRSLMPMKIERANSRGRFTDAELRAAVAESKAFWASPEGREAQRRLDQRKASATPTANAYAELFDLLKPIS